MSCKLQKRSTVKFSVFLAGDLHKFTLGLPLARLPFTHSILFWLSTHVKNQKYTIVNCNEILKKDSLKEAVKHHPSQKVTLFGAFQACFEK